jgi:hypothetical protein
MLANLEEWGGYRSRIAEALVTRYGLPERAVRFFLFFARPVPGFTEQAESVVAGLAAGEDPREASGRPCPARVWIAFWNALAGGLV